MGLEPEIAELADILSSMPGWSLDVLLVGEPEKLGAPENANPFSTEEIAARIDDAESVFESRFSSCVISAGMVRLRGSPPRDAFGGGL